MQAMGLSVPTQGVQKLIDYIALLGRWNRRFNLTAIDDPAEMVHKHLLDSLAVLPFVGDGSVLDVGSGAGLPGIPLALAKPGQSFTLIDTNGKKTRFLKQAKIELALDNVEVVNQRVEHYLPGIYFDAVIARAYASVDGILKTTRHLHNDSSRVLVMQGKLDESLNVPGYSVNQVHQLHVPGLGAARHLLEITGSR